MEVKTVALGQLFDQARAADPARVAGVRASAAAQLAGLDAMDQEQLDRSFRVFCALQDVQRATGAQGLAVRHPELLRGVVIAHSSARYPDEVRTMWAQRFAAIEQGGRLVFWRLAIKPGRPAAMGLVRGTPVVVRTG